MRAISTHNLPTLRSYAAAKAFFDNAKPWRTGDANVRPLEKRWAKNKCIVQHEDGGFAFRLYKTDCVTYYPDGLVKLNVYDSQSTDSFMYHFTPDRSFVSMCRGSMYVSLMLEGLPPEGRGWSHWRPSGGPLLIRPKKGTYGPGWDILNPEVCERQTVKRLDKERTKEIRALLKPFEQWVTAIAALGAQYVDDFMKAEGLSTIAGHLDDEQLLWLLDGHGGRYDPVEQFPRILRSLCMTRWEWRERDSSVLTLWLPDNWRDSLRVKAYRAANAFVTHEVPLGTVPPRSRW